MTPSASPRAKQVLVSLLLYAAAMAISLLLICWGRPDAFRLLAQPLAHVKNPTVDLAESLVLAGSYEPEQQRDQRQGGITRWLNNSIWKKDAVLPWSNDYWSPFSLLPGNRPIEAAYLLAILALASALVFRNVPIGLLAAWASSVFLGLGYVRMFGYTAICSAAVVIVAAKTAPVCQNTACFRAGCLILVGWIGLAWSAAISGRMDALIPEGQHVSRFGKTPVYDDAITNWVKTTFPKDRVFTTIETGSYCLLAWDFGKQVFLDGFFAPHARSVWLAYRKAYKDGDLRPLAEDFGISLAILPMTSRDWIDRFRIAQDWHPIAVGAGNVVFAHRSLRNRPSKPKILATAESLRESSLFFRHAALRTLFLLVASENRSGIGFTSTDWTSLPEFTPLQKMAGEVFPTAE